MKKIPFGLVVIAACGLIVLAAGIRVAIWIHQVESIGAEREQGSRQRVVLADLMRAATELDNTRQGYLSTDDPALSEAGARAGGDLRAALANAQILLRNMPEAGSAMDALARLVQSEQDEATRTFNLTAAARHAAALDPAAGARARQILTALRSSFDALADGIGAREAALQDVRTQQFTDIYILMAFVVLVVDLLVVVAIVSLSISIQRIREQHREEAQAAMHDALTGLPNRRYLSEWLAMALAAARRSGQQLAILYFDLDGFKSVNDRLGHTAGDQVLQVTAERLRSSLRLSDFIARLGGDEFVAALPDAPDAPGLYGLVARLQTELAKAPIPELDDNAVTASIGAAWYPGDGDSVEKLLAAADHAMYEVKRGRRVWRPAGLETGENKRGPIRAVAR